jgi:putative flippase GtrA
MFAAVKLIHLTPVVATVIGASGGAITNFGVNRSFTYRAGQGRATGQLWKFVVVSAASLGLNALGEYTFFGLLGLQFMLARVITAIIVSNGWNYPMLRFFVFSRRSKSKSRLESK